MKERTVFQRLTQNWVYGGFISSFILAAVGIVLLQDHSLTYLLLFLHLPAYQIHQLEEHDRDRFRHYMNEKVGHGRELLSVAAVFWINIGLVWAVFTLFISLALLLGVGWGLPVVYGTLFNALIHLAAAFKNREYNPGVVTAAILFLPLSIATLWMISANPAVTKLQQIFGVAIGLGIHIGIVLYCIYKGRRPLGSGDSFPDSDK